MKLKEVQDRSYELLCVLDDICTQEHVSYKLDSGTAIGAVREKDLIPWDDDIDIKVRLEDYPAFKEAMRKHLPDYCLLLEPDDFSPHFYDFLVRVVDTRFTLRAENEEDQFYQNKKNHVGIDVFLEFYMPDNAIKRKLAYYRLNLIYGLAMGHRYRIDYSKHSIVEKAAIAGMSTIGRLIPVKTICRHFRKVIEKYNRRPTEWEYRTWFAPESIQPSGWHLKTAQGELRGRKFPLSIGYHEELTQFYGDYMKPPKDRSIYEQHLDEKDRYENS